MSHSYQHAHRHKGYEQEFFGPDLCPICNQLPEIPKPRSLAARTNDYLNGSKWWLVISLIAATTNLFLFITQGWWICLVLFALNVINIGSNKNVSSGRTKRPAQIPDEPESNEGNLTGAKMLIMSSIGIVEYIRHQELEPTPEQKEIARLRMEITELKKPKPEPHPSMFEELTMREAQIGQLNQELIETRRRLSSREAQVAKLEQELDAWKPRPGLVNPPSRKSLKRCDECYELTTNCECVV